MARLIFNDNAGYSFGGFSLKGHIVHGYPNMHGAYAVDKKALLELGIRIEDMAFAANNKVIYFNAYSVTVLGDE